MVYISDFVSKSQLLEAQLMITTTLYPLSFYNNFVFTFTLFETNYDDIDFKVAGHPRHIVAIAPIRTFLGQA